MEVKQLEFKLITTTKNKKLKLTHKQIVVLLEALWDFKESIKTIGTDTEEFLRKRLLENKIEEVDKLFKILEESINYDFQKHLEKCSKKNKNDDPGMETMSWLDKK
ncbi:hypothetical protein C3495_06250 [Clostridiaceae bacterium 14S0207]|nr:hypothetical protein C3495_06250 [Clostridiaceae bacterium 14S0207]